MQPQLVQGIGFLSTLNPTVTSLISGPHRGSAHGEGRAVDVGAFGGVDVGVNESTIRALVVSIRSRRFSRVGTLAPLVRALGPWAWSNYKVEMFEDDKKTGATGPHVHFEVAP